MALSTQSAGDVKSQWNPILVFDLIFLGSIIFVLLFVYICSLLSHSRKTKSYSRKTQSTIVK